MLDNGWLPPKEIFEINKNSSVITSQLGLYVQEIAWYPRGAKALEVDNLWEIHLDLTPAELEKKIIETVNHNPELLERIEIVDIFHSEKPLIYDGTKLNFFVGVSPKGYKKKERYAAITSLISALGLKGFNCYNVVYANQIKPPFQTETAEYENLRLFFSKG